MKNVNKKRALVSLFGFITTSVYAFGYGNFPVTPAGWSIREIYPNVIIYEKSGIFAQVLDIGSGAKIRLMYSTPSKVKFPSGVIGNGFSKHSINSYWGNISNNSKAISVVNGQFFATAWDPTILSFGVKADGKLLDLGMDKNSYNNFPRQVEFTDGAGARIMTWDEKRLQPNVSTAQNILVGLNSSDDRKSSSSIGRNYVCTLKSAPGQWAAFFIAKQATQPQMDAAMTSWKCLGSIMFDGSGSSQMVTRGGNIVYGSALSAWYMPDYRLLPMAIAIYNN